MLEEDDDNQTVADDLMDATAHQMEAMRHQLKAHARVTSATHRLDNTSDNAVSMVRVVLDALRQWLELPEYAGIDIKIRLPSASGEALATRFGVPHPAQCTGSHVVLYKNLRTDRAGERGQTGSLDRVILQQAEVAA